MEENVKTSDSIIKDIWFAFKRNLVLVIALVLFCTACGIGYAFIKKPNYTATEEVVCMAEDTSNSNIVTNFNIMNAYINTIVDFCDEGVVIERANFYYIQYRNQYRNQSAQGSVTSLDEFIEDVRTEDPYVTNDNSPADKKYIVKENVSVSAKVETNQTDEYSFSISYTDPNLELALIKAKIYVLAFEREIGTEKGTNGDRYFAGVKISIISLGNSGWSSDVSKVKFTIIGFAIGVVVAAIAVYVISVTDVSIKDKEELERITGVSVLANIDHVGGKK
ncbi:MAG: hypothetical protein IJA88_05325 [Clostridia bacterium]|nr:hypothetical protein [Clostridia bacterium]